MLRTHAVTIVPGLGHSDSFGAYDRGQSVGPFAELDVIDGYLPTLLEELDIDGVRYEVMPTRKRPGVNADARHKQIESERMVIHLGAGFYRGRADPQKNTSAVFFGDPMAKDLARELSEALMSWGQCYVWGHRSSRPEPDPEDLVINVKGTMGLRVEPFQINAPDADEYMRRLPELGKCLGRAVSSYLLVRKQARSRITMTLDNRRT